MKTNVLFSSTMNEPDRQESEFEDACIPNINPIERKRRLQFGMYQLIASLVVLVALVLLNVNPLWRLPLFFLFAAGATGYFQAKDKT